MLEPKKIIILRTGNRVVLEPTTAKVRRLLTPKLSYIEKVFLRGYERQRARNVGAPEVEEKEWECFDFDHRGRLATSFGFTKRITHTLRNLGYEVELQDLAPHPRPEVYEPKWDNIFDGTTELRHKQDEALLLFATHENGRIDCPPGWGKSHMIGLWCRAFPKAKFAVVTRRVPVLCSRIYPELCQMVPSVGIVGGGKKVKGKRVMCYTAASLHHALGDEDFVIFDECHEACSDDCAAKMGIFRFARMWGLSATHEMRLDNKDLRAEAMFGPIRLKVHYREAVKHNMVVPIEVHWNDVIMDYDPCSGEDDSTERKRNGVWSNHHRNRLIAKDARRYGDDVQVLIAVETLEHALYLKKLLPEFELVSREANTGDSAWWKRWKRLMRQGLVPEGVRPMTLKRKDWLTRAFERGRLKKVICTTVWNVGVNFRYLQVMIRADAGGSPINDTQIPGRASRRNDAGKQVGIVHDYLDQFNRGFMQKSKGRQKSYKSNEWRQLFPDAHSRSALRQRLLDGSYE
ncbi:MAG: hypothetical protein L0312_20020 [Acidobacteria bacterium]|nr:hypothetical protein [Acidobacteriota bacterium]